jgi:hypothetical protein
VLQVDDGEERVTSVTLSFEVSVQLFKYVFLYHLPFSSYQLTMTILPG